MMSFQGYVFYILRGCRPSLLRTDMGYPMSVLSSDAPRFPRSACRKQAIYLYSCFQQRALTEGRKKMSLLIRERYVLHAT